MYFTAKFCTVFFFFFVEIELVLDSSQVACFQVACFEDKRVKKMSGRMFRDGTDDCILLTAMFGECGG